MRDHKIIHYMESNCFDLLFEENGSVSLKEKEEIDLALKNLKEVLHMMPEAIFVVDKESVSEYPGKTSKRRLHHGIPLRSVFRTIW